MTVRRTLILFTVLLLMAATAAFADSQARIVRLSYTEGAVDIDRGEGNSHAFLNMPVIEGSKLSTGHDARVEVEFEDGSTMRLVPDSSVEFQELRLRNNGGRATLVGVLQGTAYFNVRKHNEDEFRVAAGREQVALAKTSRFRVEMLPDTLRLAVFKGDLDLIRATGDRLPIRKEETVEIALNDPTRYYLSRGIREATFDYWDKDRDKERETYARNQTYQHEIGVYYGTAEMARYGGFFTVAGYGSLWRPYGYAVGWDPFYDGSWVWYPTAGYVWVSPYRWGWTPYRYGQWLYVNNYGWCWRPSHVWNTWYAAPPVIYPHATYTRNIPPPVRRDPVIVTRDGGGRTLTNDGGGTREIRTGGDIITIRDGKEIATNEDRPFRGLRDSGDATVGPVKGISVVRGTDERRPARAMRDGSDSPAAFSSTGISNTNMATPTSTTTVVERPSRTGREVEAESNTGRTPDSRHANDSAQTTTPTPAPRAEPPARPERSSRMSDVPHEQPAPRPMPSSPPMRMSPPSSGPPPSSAPAPRSAPPASARSPRDR